MVNRWLVWLAAFAVFALTAYPTITWWESSSYSLAAATLGLTPPPGSLLLTLLGWAITRVPTGLATAHELNLFAGALAATTVALVLSIALRLLRQAGDGAKPGLTQAPVAVVAGAAAGAGVGALAFGFSATLWEYAVQFTPYVLTSVFTGLLLWTLLRWWEGADDPQSWHWILAPGLLFGLDYSVHRTNALLMPGALVWILIRQPRTLLRARTWMAAAGGLVAGLALQLLIIPLAAGHPPINIGDPSTWSRFYDYESLAQMGGGWLVNLYPRRAALWSVQVMDFLRAFGANFFWLSGRWAILGWLPALLGVLGWLGLWRRDRRLALALLSVLLLHAVATVAYFNVPAQYFRSVYRHYFPVFVTFGVLVCCGAGDVTVWLRASSLRGSRWRAVPWAGGLLLLAPLSQLVHNWRAVDGSHHTFTEDFAVNLLSGLPPGAMLFTVGDNDTFPLWYAQAVLHVRPDVQIVNLPLSNTRWYLNDLTRRDPFFPLPPGYADSLSARPWTDTTLTIPVAGTAAESGLPEDLALPRSISLRVGAAMGGDYILPQDLVLLQILQNNHWRRPLCFSITADRLALPGLAPYARLDGVFWRVVPHADPPVNRAILRRNLLETYRYRGYADPGVRLDQTSRSLGRNYYLPLVALARAEYAAGGAEQCRLVREAVMRALPPARLQPEDALRQEMEGACVSPAPTPP